MSSKITFFILVLILGFQINVKAEIVEVPNGCKGRVYPCFIHVKNTKELGHFKIKKEESSAAGVRRIKAVLE